MTFLEISADERSLWVKNAPHRAKAYNVIHSFDWFVFSEPENILYADREKNVRLGSFEDFISIAAALGWTGEGWGSIPASNDALPIIQYLFDLSADLPIESAVAMHRMGFTIDDARNAAIHGIDIEMLNAVESEGVL